MEALSNLRAVIREAETPYRNFILINRFTLAKEKKNKV